LSRAAAPIDLYGLLPAGWRPFFIREQLDEVSHFLEQQTKVNRDWHPPLSDIFLPLKLTDPDGFSVCLIGQDPYPQAGLPTGLPFSVSPSVPIDGIPASLHILFWELVRDLRALQPPQLCPRSGDLRRWTEFCLMWNVAPTCEVDQRGSHLRVWRRVTRHLLQTIAEKRKVVFLAWGKEARDALPKPIAGRHLVISSGSPSPQAAYRHGFVGSRPFTQTTRAAASLKLQPVPSWRL
jgi:uracil-DNA glycosylase